jgi:hypothetical protein
MFECYIKKHCLTQNTHTHTHTHIYIDIYIYGNFKLLVAAMLTSHYQTFIYQESSFKLIIAYRFEIKFLYNIRHKIIEINKIKI